MLNELRGIADDLETVDGARRLAYDVLPAESRAARGAAALFDEKR